MKKNSILWAALSMTAALVMTACSSDNDVTEAPVAPSTSKTIPYTVTVGSGDATTRATVKDDPTDRKLYFAEGDKLYITGTNIKGVLSLQDGDEGKASGATFSGDLTYSGEGSPAANLQLTATLVSAQQTDGEEVTINATTGAVTVNYPTTAYCADVATAVQEYSRLTGTCEYSQKAFSLTQQTAFLNFEITVTDGTSGTTLPAKFINNGATLATANVTTVSDGGVKAKFVLPVAAGTPLSSATVKLGGKQITETISNATLTGKVYNVKKTMSAVTLADVFTDDAVVTVTVNTANDEWFGATGTYTSGTYATTGIGSIFPPSSVSMTKDGSNLVATVTSDYNTYTVTFNTTDNTYVENATAVDISWRMTTLKSITINGVDITSSLTIAAPAPAPTLADAFTDDAVVTVTVNTANDQWLGVTGTYTSGTYATTGIGSIFPPSSVSMTKDGSNLVATVTFDNTYTVTFNTTNNTYVENATAVDLPWRMTTLKSITINGVDITSSLTIAAPVETTWIFSEMTGENPNLNEGYTYKGVTLSGDGNLDINHGNLNSDDLTFTAPTGKHFKSIVINATMSANISGWTNGGEPDNWTSTWTGDASSVSFTGDTDGVTSIVFTIE